MKWHVTVTGLAQQRSFDVKAELFQFVGGVLFATNLDREIVFAYRPCDGDAVSITKEAACQNGAID